jgi:opacity protein-like surface antigen
MIKRLLLGSAAAVMAVTGAQAADLPVAEPVEYVRVCDSFGTGFFYIPGTETCLRISGFVRADYRFLESNNTLAGGVIGKDVDRFQFRSRARLNFDARTATEFGTLRSFIRFRFTDTSPAGDVEGGDLRSGFVQFAGITAGMTSSFFDFWTGYSTYANHQPFISDKSTQLLLGYSFAVGNGVTLNVSIEDQGDNDYDDGAGFVILSNAAEGGQVLPDLVASVRVDQGWGSAQVMGAVKEIRSALGNVDAEYGWAIGAGVEVNVPMIGSGTRVALQGAWAEGAVDYITNDNFVEYGPTGVGHFSGTVVGTGISKSEMWAINGGVRFGVAPNVTVAIDGGYTDFDAPAAAGAAADFDAFSVRGSVFYRPVSGLTLAAYVGYEDVDVGGVGSQDVDLIEGIFRIQRDF